jgi:hypothetical protein
MNINIKISLPVSYFDSSKCGPGPTFKSAKRLIPFVLKFDASSKGLATQKRRCEMLQMQGSYQYKNPSVASFSIL